MWGIGKLSSKRSYFKLVKPNIRVRLLDLFFYSSWLNCKILCKNSKLFFSIQVEASGTIHDPVVDFYINRFVALKSQ